MAELGGDDRGVVWQIAFFIESRIKMKISIVNDKSMNGKSDIYDCYSKKKMKYSAPCLVINGE